MKRFTARQYAESFAAVPARQRPAAALRLLSILRRARAMRLLPRIVTHLQTLDDKKSGHVRVLVEAATDTEAKAAQRLVTKVFPKAVLQTSLRPELDAGFRLRLGDKQLDATLRGQLAHLRSTLVS